MDKTFESENSGQDESGARVTDAEKAHAIAESSTEQRSVAAFERQLVEIMKRNESKELTHEELLTATKELMDAYPEEHEFPLSEHPGRHEYLAESSDRLAERLEYWTGVLHDHPQESISARELIRTENELNRDERAVSEYHEFARTLPDIIKNKGLSWLNGRSGLKEFLRGEETGKLIEDYDLKLKELLGDQDTKISDIVALKKKLIEDCVSNKRYGYFFMIAQNRDMLESVTNGTYKAKQAV